MASSIFFLLIYELCTDKTNAHWPKLWNPEKENRRLILFGSKKQNIIQSQQDIGIWYTILSPAVLKLAETIQTLLKLILFNFSCLPFIWDHGILLLLLLVMMNMQMLNWTFLSEASMILQKQSDFYRNFMTFYMLKSHGRPHKY